MKDYRLHEHFTNTPVREAWSDAARAAALAARHAKAKGPDAGDDKAAGAHADIARQHGFEPGGDIQSTLGRGNDPKHAEPAVLFKSGKGELHVSPTTGRWAHYGDAAFDYPLIGSGDGPDSLARHLRKGAR